MGDNKTRQYFEYIRDDRGRFLPQGKEVRVFMRCTKADLSVLRDACARRRCTMSALLLGSAKREIAAELTADG